MPHPPLLIPKIGGANLERVLDTKAAMEEVSLAIIAAKPESIIFISPHSPIASGRFTVKTGPRLEGSFADFGHPEIIFSVKNDVPIARAIIKGAAAKGIEVISLEEKGHAHLSRLDHGVMVPLNFLAKWIDLPIVSISVSDLNLLDHFELGKAVATVSNEIGGRIALIASGDLSHRLTVDSPISYNPRGKEFDLAVKRLVEKADLEGLMRMDPDLIEEAGECGLRSFTILAGAFFDVSYQTHTYSYEGPFGVGYLVASLTPTGRE